MFTIHFHFQLDARLKGIASKALIVYAPSWMHDFQEANKEPLDIHGQYAIIMFDVSARSTYKNAVHGTVVSADDISLCARTSLLFSVVTKVDVKNRQVTFHIKKNLQYYEISAKSNYNFEKPFLYLVGGTKCGGSHKDNGWEMRCNSILVE
ncbi:hypothetical protein TB2_043394 [Malus domestica]